MNWNYLLIFTGLQILWKLLNNPQKAAEVQQKFVEAKSSEDVRAAVSEAITGAVNAVITDDVPPEVIGDIIDATTGEEVDMALDNSKVKGGIFELVGGVVGGIVGGIGQALFGKK